MQCPSPVHTSVVSSATMCWGGHNTCSHTCHFPTSPHPRHHRHACSHIDHRSIDRAPTLPPGGTGIHVCMAATLRAALWWCGVGTLVHALAVSAVPRGMCLPVCTPVCPAPPCGGVDIPVHMPALNHSSNIWPCRHSCLPFWCPGASVNSKGTPERSCTAKHLHGHTHSCLLCPVLQRM